MQDMGRHSIPGALLSFWIMALLLISGSGCTVPLYKDSFNKQYEQQQAEALRFLNAPPNQPSRPDEILASTVSELTERSMKELGSRNDIVLVMFVAQNEVTTTLYKIRDTMRSRDPKSSLNPYWVIDVPGLVGDPQTNCGVVVGHWYAYEKYPYRAPWERIVDAVLEREATYGTYLYSHNGKFLLTEDGQPEMEALQEVCFPGHALASTRFDSFGAAKQSRPALARWRPTSTSDEFATVQTTTKDVVAKTLMGDTLVGQACVNTVNINLRITDVFLNNRAEQNDPMYLMKGVLKVSRNAQTSPEIALVGAISRVNGVVNLAASSEEPNPRYRNTIISLFRDDADSGLEGMIEGMEETETAGCDDVRLTSKNGTKLTAFPKMTAQVAFFFSNPQMAPRSKLYSVYWLKVAEARDSIDAPYYLGSRYEQRGATDPNYYALAVQYYLAATTAYDDARAQAALGRMYEKGQGTKRDPEKAEQWSSVAKTTRQGATRICASPQVREVIQRLLTQVYLQNKAGSEAMNALTGIRPDRGEITISKVTAEDVLSLNHAFICRAKGGFDNPNFQMEMPETKITVWRDQYGNVTTTDNSMEQFSSQAGPALMNEAARNVVNYLTFKLTPLGNSRFKITYRGPRGIQSEELQVN
ncbi:MAG: sel1 repeat family protein [Nitrospiraceae bacterium]|nr:sel1 repeat family protein [Nitrospiraceae bacterium]